MPCCWIPPLLRTCWRASTAAPAPSRKCRARRCWGWLPRQICARDGTFAFPTHNACLPPLREPSSFIATCRCLPPQRSNMPPRRCGSMYHCRPYYTLFDACHTTSCTTGCSARNSGAHAATYFPVDVLHWRLLRHHLPGLHRHRAFTRPHQPAPACQPVPPSQPPSPPPSSSTMPLNGSPPSFCPLAGQQDRNIGHKQLL